MGLFVPCSLSYPGFSVLLFIGTIWSLTAKQRIQSVNCPIAAVAILLFVLSTAHMIVNIIRVEDRLVKYRNTYPGVPVGSFADPSQIPLLILRGLYVLQTMLADEVVKLSERSIAATSCDNHSGSSSYHACCGAVLQRGVQLFTSLKRLRRLLRQRGWRNHTVGHGALRLDNDNQRAHWHDALCLFISSSSPFHETGPGWPSHTIGYWAITRIYFYL
ncbi:hypothetical protein CY34DRAFT_532203 [Suillus luteus UH-Slu-Lm8-n1]|uniref:Unplaced genomic scaffold CY34scaffold_414, whole genome shotgun sequence n=1 Tax=Suillus luteus UH-Slu-Lm8-n1 TaxID=930992 RepID=A0A0D0APH2_9AGAM|nr:hypothetical protein CY34DRAFT_532203 [Suillus luteus UH-Slu-Lm8-n1]